VQSTGRKAALRGGHTAMIATALARLLAGSRWGRPGKAGKREQLGLRLRPGGWGGLPVGGCQVLVAGCWLVVGGGGLLVW
jgi:hypothetical protein